MARTRGRGDSLEDRSHVPNHCPHRIAPEVAALLVAARRQYGWGSRKLLAILTAQHPSLPWPARSTANDLFAREHLLRRPRWTHPRAALLVTTRPNQVWPADFKGQFKAATGAIAIRSP